MKYFLGGKDRSIGLYGGRVVEAPNVSAAVALAPELDCDYAREVLAGSTPRANLLSANRR